MAKKTATRMGPDTKTTQLLLVGAQLLTLFALLLGLQFLLNTTGGTLFAFSAAGPVLVFTSILILAGVAFYRFRKRHSLFDFETYEPGEVIIREGEPGDCAYFIRKGEVEVVRERDGAQTVLARLKEGQYFGEMALLTNRPRNATVRAVTATQLALLGKQNFLTMLSVVPSTQADIMKTVQERAMKQ